MKIWHQMNHCDELMNDYNFMKCNGKNALISECPVKVNSHLGMYFEVLVLLSSLRC
jgi:hypothetical protein